LIPRSPTCSFCPTRRSSDLCLQGCQLEVVPLQSDAPPSSPRRNAPRAGDNIGLWGEDLHTGRSFFYAPGLAILAPQADIVSGSGDRKSTRLNSSHAKISYAV